MRSLLEIADDELILGWRDSEWTGIAPRDSLHEIEDFVDELGRNYHRVDGYPLKEKLGRARELAAKSADALSAGSG